MIFYKSDFKSGELFEGMLVELGIPEEEAKTYEEIEVTMKLPVPNSIRLIKELATEGGPK